MGVDEIMQEVADLNVFCMCFCGGEYFVCFAISEVFLECLFDDFFAVENADSHVFVCLKNHQIWVVNEFMESVFLQLTDVGEGFLLKFDVLLSQLHCKIVDS